MTKRWLMWEYIALFLALPALIAWLKPHSLIYPLLWLFTMLSGYRLEKAFGWSFRTDWNFAALNHAAVKAILLRFIPCAIALLAFVWFVIPNHLFSLPRQRPLVWVMVMLLYPPLSALPQEIIFRSFIFRRFSAWLTPSQLMVASVLAFGWVHIILMNGVAVLFSFFGGLMFAHTYSKTKSLAACCFEHALYGCYIFTIGLGFYFYHGQAVR